VIEGNWLLHRHSPERHGHEEQDGDERQQDQEVATCPRRHLPFRDFRLVPWRSQASGMTQAHGGRAQLVQGIPR
jgi:hypothetical protein